ncbi:1-acyl-sn-glycerol-3-phosphate acyltransferase [bacterium]|nr:MAG: 1-acyl-sn-glycerol-3-phosphate acyltransferase [bacterium]
MTPTFSGAPPFFRAACAVVRGFAGLTKGLSLEGLEHLPPSGPVIVAGNHVSLIEGPLVGYAVGRVRQPSFMIKEELFRFPPLGWTLRELGGIPLDRGGRGDVKALRRALNVLAGGGCMVVFPEGTRSKDGQPLKPKAGVGLLARQSGAPVVPVRARNTLSALSGERPYRLTFGAPVPAPPKDPEDSRSADRAFAEAVMAAIFAL